MLYRKNSNKKLDDNLFKKPTSEYRGAPFWSWNCKLTKDLLQTQIEYLKRMGFGGFHMHSRTGMATEYLSDEYMELIKACVDKAEKENMLAWLYDEDRWPSGAAGGLLTSNPKYRMRKLVFTQNAIVGCVPRETAVETGKPYFIACYDIILNGNGELAKYKRIDKDEKVKGDKWFAYSLTNEPSPWYNNQTYADTLSKEAIDKFIEITYECYKKTIGYSFGTITPAIFTDEPQFEKKTTLDYSTDKTDIRLPWCNDLDQTYAAAYSCDLLEILPEIIWELPDNRISKARYLYHDHITERFASAFADNCGSWCEENNLLLTGHMMEEPTLKSQTAMIGEAMRSYRSFQLPGIDILCNSVEFTTAKQAQSAAHQYGREGVISELYGVTNWDFDFRGHKFQGDWQAALGVTVRVPHLSWVSMAGEAKRDYPASINYQSPWYMEYPYVEDHFARVNTALTRGKPIIKVGVIHPIESYWLHWGPKESTSNICRQLDNNFENITNWLLLGQIDFDYICESLLPDLSREGSNPLQVGEMNYSTIIVPACETLRQTTLDRLTAFQKSGGNLVFAGECPKYIDAVLSDSAVGLYNDSIRVDFNQVSILTALKNEKIIDIRNNDGTLTDNLIYSMRQDNDCKWLFIAHGVKTIHVDATRPQKIIINVNGEYTPVLYDTLTGDICEIEYSIENGNTLINTELNCHDSILFKLQNYNGQEFKSTHTSNKMEIAQIDFKSKVTYERCEPNVLLLDTAQYSFDDGEYQSEEEILRIDNILRDKMGWPSRQEHVAQPWTLDEENIEHHVTLKFTINSEIRVDNPVLAIEDAEKLDIVLNNIHIKNKTSGWYVDESIKKVNLPPLEKGENILTAKIPFGRTTNVEYCYILGDFNVKVEGFVKTIIEPSDMIGFSTITDQGMPFYGGNIIYKTEIGTNDCSLVIKVNNYRGAIVAVSIDGKRAGVIAYAPYKLAIEDIKAGKHTVEFTLFGNRYNTFAALHNANTAISWYGPDTWRTGGDEWCYEYKLKDTGIMASPVIQVFE